MDRTTCLSVWMEERGSRANPEEEYSVKMRLRSYPQNLADESTPLPLTVASLSLPSLSRLFPVSLPKIRRGWAWSGTPSPRNEIAGRRRGASAARARCREAVRAASPPQMPPMVPPPPQGRDAVRLSAPPRRESAADAASGLCFARLPDREPRQAARTSCMAALSVPLYDETRCRRREGHK